MIEPRSNSLTSALAPTVTVIDRPDMADTSRDHTDWADSFADREGTSIRACRACGGHRRGGARPQHAYGECLDCRELYDRAHWFDTYGYRLAKRAIAWERANPGWVDSEKYIALFTPNLSRGRMANHRRDCRSCLLERAKRADPDGWDSAHASGNWSAWLNAYEATERAS